MYLNSLYNLIFRNNPVRASFQGFLQTLVMVINYRRNMQHARRKLDRLQHQYQTVETYMNSNIPSYNHRFNVMR